jgi:hypothetical protein
LKDLKNWKYQRVSRKITYYVWIKSKLKKSLI